MSDNASAVVGSDQIVDHACDICDGQDTAAVEYCRQCEQFYCLKCSQYHKKIRLTRNHKILGKEDFEEISRKPPLFQRQIVPVASYSLPKEYYTSGKHRQAHTFSITTVLTSSTSNKSIMLNTGRQKLFVVGEDSKVTGYEMKEKCHTFIEHPSFINILVFTVPSINEIKWMDLSEPGKLGVLFKTLGECWGLTELDNGLAVSVKMATGLSLPEWQIQYMDFNGKVKNRIMYDNEGKAMFKSPKLLASNPDKDLLYVNDTGGFHVTALNVLGEILFRWKRDGNCHPNSLSVDHEQNLYMVYSGAVIQVKRDRSQERVIVSSKEITSASFNSEAETLAVADKTGKVNILQYSP